MRILSTIAVTTTVLAACSSFSEEPAAPPTGTLDAGSDATGGGATGSDATGGDGAVATGCAALFCAAFDGEPFDGEWDGYDQGPQPVITIRLSPTEDAPLSPRRALRLALPASAALYQSNHLTKRVALPAGARSLTFRFAIRLQTPNTLDGTVRVAAMTWGDPAAKQAVWTWAYLAGDQLTMRIEQDSNTLQSTTTRRLEVGRWYDMATTITFASASSATMESFAGGVSYDKGEFDPKVLPGAAAELYLGANYAAAAWTKTAVDFDDVSFDAK